MSLLPRALGLCSLVQKGLLAQRTKGPSLLTLATPLATPSLNRTLHTSTVLEKHGFFDQKSANELWKASTSVSAQGRQRGRAKGLVRRKNLNMGRRLGYGPAKISWPGLNIRVSSKEDGFGKIERMPSSDFKKYEEQVELRQKKPSFRRIRTQTALERGWTSKSPQGKLFPEPQSTDQSVSFDGFESVLIEYKVVTHMTGNFGRVRSVSLLMVTGNGNGLAGFALTKVPSGRGNNREQFKKAVNRAGMKICHIDLYEGRTVYHDFFTQFGSTRLVVLQKPRGYGLKGHRTVVAACKVIGLQDLEVILEGATNYQHIIKALFLGLLRQRTHQMLADEKGLHLVEFREENDNYPRVVASPSNGYVRTQDDILPNEILDFDSIIYEGQLPSALTSHENKQRDISKMEGYDRYLKKRYHIFPHYEQRIQTLAEHGEIRSHLTDHFPECRLKPKKVKEEEEEEQSEQ